MELNVFSYLYGLLITDGNFYFQNKNKSRVTLELSIKDRDIIEKIEKIVPNSTIRFRTRDTNFKKKFTSIIFSNCRKDFADLFIKAGFPIENKTDNAGAPSTEYIEKDFWRGVIDGDGSLGFTKDGEPFVSLVTKSEKMKDDYLNFLFRVFSIQKKISRNNRDNVYNIVIKNEDAVNFVKFIYSDEKDLFLDRKYEKACSILKWKRTKKKINRKPFSEEEIEYIKTHSVKECMKTLERTKASIEMKKYRLRQESNNK